MAAADDITQAIADPSSASSDGQSVTTRSASDLITLLNYQATLATINKRRRGIRYSKLLNPGALDPGRAGFYGDAYFNGGYPLG